MRVYLCGQKYFGQEALALLRRLGHDIAGVSAPRETPDGRADRLWLAAEGLPRLQAGRLNADALPDGVDLIVAAHSHDFIGRRTRLRSRLGAIGYHPSLLPLHRGRDAVRWAVKLRERITGGSIYWFNDTVDGGPIAAQDWCFIRPDDTADELWRRDLQPMGLRLLERALGDIARGVLVQVPQDTALATWEPALNPPPLRRPDLLMLGDGRAAGYRVVRDAEAIHAPPPPRAQSWGAPGMFDDDLVAAVEDFVLPAGFVNDRS
jgi:methionyl-tRNA formyltransferase